MHSKQAMQSVIRNTSEPQTLLSRCTLPKRVSYSPDSFLVIYFDLPQKDPISPSSCKITSTGYISLSELLL